MITSEITNRSDLPWRITEAKGAFQEQYLQHAGRAIVKLGPEVKSLTLVMNNAFVGSRQYLNVEWKL